MSYTHTVVGIFDSEFDAQDAADLLMDKGFNRSEIDVRSRNDVNVHAGEGELTGQHQHHHESGFTAFFRTLFGNNDEDADKHNRVASQAGAVVTVYTNSEEEASRAADILDDKGAVDVNERASGFGETTTANTTAGTEDYPRANTSRSYDKPVIDPDDNSYAAARNLDRQTDEDFSERPRIEERSGPGIGATPTSGMRSKSRINEWSGESSARLREDRDAETKTGW